MSGLPRACKMRGACGVSLCHVRVCVCGLLVFGVSALRVCGVSCMCACCSCFAFIAMRYPLQLHLSNTPCAYLLATERFNYTRRKVEVNNDIIFQTQN